jgi:hypothetical protein
MKVIGFPNFLDIGHEGASSQQGCPPNFDTNSVIGVADCRK